MFPRKIITVSEKSYWENNVICVGKKLVKALGWSHGALDVQSSDVLPVLLQQRYKEVDGDGDVGSELLRCHADMTNSNSQAKNLQ